MQCIVTLIIIKPVSTGAENMGTPDSSELRVAVVGGGIIGLAVADALCRRGAIVTLLEKNRIAQGTSANTFSWLNATSKSSDEDYHRLNAAGLKAWQVRAQRFGEDAIGLNPGGMIEWIDAANGRANAALEERIRRLSGWGYAARAVDRVELDRLEPHFDYPPDARGIFAPGDAWLDPTRAADHLAERIRAGGGTIREQCAAQMIRRSNGVIDGVQTDADLVPCSRVVIAAGHETNAATAKLISCPAFAHRGAVGAVPGALVQTPPVRPHQWVRRVVYCEFHGPIHIRPAPNGGLLLGGDDTDGWIADGHDETILDRIERQLLDRARKLIPELPVDAWRGGCDRCVGVRPMPADGRSIIDALPNAPGVFLAATHSGMTLGLLIGRLLADWIVSGSRPAILAPFGYHRFEPSRGSGSC